MRRVVFANWSGGGRRNRFQGWRASKSETQGRNVTAASAFQPGAEGLNSVGVFNLAEVWQGKFAQPSQ